MRRTHLAVLFLAASLLGARADDAPPPIREFDLPTIEKLGRQMYELDQDAWKATDILVARYGLDDLKARGLKGWIVDTNPGGDVVHFIRDGGGGPELFTDVSFAKAGAPVLSEPRNLVLSAEDRAKYDARTLAIAQADRSCAESHNTIVLKDPERGGWLVWVMAATSDPDLVVMGKHYRFTISADGRSVVRKDALSKTCVQFSREDAAGAPGMLARHYLSLTPLETHVFASLSYKMVFYIGTSDGKAWKIDSGRVAGVEQDAAGDDGQSARSLAGHAEKCQVVLNRPVGGKPNYSLEGDTKVILPTEQDAKFSLQAPASAQAVSVTCDRLDIVPAPNDYKVLAAGYTLSVADRGAGHPYRLGELVLTGGTVQFRLLDGAELTGDIKARLGSRVDAFQKALQAKP